MQVGRTRGIRDKADKGVPGPRRLDSPELPALRNLRIRRADSECYTVREWNNGHHYRGASEITPQFRIPTTPLAFCPIFTLTLTPPSSSARYALRPVIVTISHFVSKALCMKSKLKHLSKFSMASCAIDHQASLPHSPLVFDFLRSDTYSHTLRATITVKYNVKCPPWNVRERLVFPTAVTVIPGNRPTLLHLGISWIFSTASILIDCSVPPLAQPCITTRPPFVFLTSVTTG